MIKKGILKGSIFTIILILAMSYLNSLFIIKTGHRSKLYQGLYANIGDKYDVVLLGSSHMDGAVNPNLLWKDYGITSFNYATAGQPIDVTYYLLKEILKKQEKPIVVIDLYYLGLTEKYGQEGYIRYVLDNMKLSKNKIEAISACTPEKLRDSYIFPFFKYHNRWKDLTVTDFKFDKLNTYYEKGFTAGQNKYGKENQANVFIEGVDELPPKSQEYLNKIINLSKQEGFKVIFTNAPYDYTSTWGRVDWHKNQAKMFNKVEEICKENDIEFINYCKKLNELEFDFKNDMNNVGHVNIWGANKVTTHLGKYLKENYDLKDHREDKNYEKWNTDYERYLQKQASNTLSIQTDIKQYGSLLVDNNYIIAVSCNNYNFTNNESEIHEVLGYLGLDFKKRNSNGSYVAIINKNKVELEKTSPDKLCEELNLDNDVEIQVRSSSNDKNIPSVIINGSEYSNKSDGLSIVVYDKILNSVVDNICLDYNNKIIR